MKLWQFINDVMFKGRRIKGYYVTTPLWPFCLFAILPTGTQIRNVRFYLKSLLSTNDVTHTTKEFVTTLRLIFGLLSN